MSVEQYKLHDNVAIPAIVRGGTRASKYPFSTMAVGKMFFVPEAPKTFASQANAAGRKLGRKFVVRRVTLDGQIGMGCWRVADPVASDESADEE